MRDVTEPLPRKELLRLLSRETAWSVNDLRWWVAMLSTLGWDAHQIRRGVKLVAGSAGRLRLENLVTMSRVVDDPDKILDALTTGRTMHNAPAISHSRGEQ